MPVIQCQYYINTCLLCRAGSVIKVLPPFSAGLRVLSLDGGGAWGRLTLEMIGVIQNMMGPVLKYQDFFDVAYGTSVGGYSASLLVAVTLTYE